MTQGEQWEYLALDLNDLPRKTDELDLLNDADEVAWELVLITANRIAIFASTSRERRGLIQRRPSNERERLALGVSTSA